MFSRRTWGILLAVFAAFSLRSIFQTAEDLSDPEIDQNPYEIIASRGYQADEYEVLTEDGYYLTLYRMRNMTAVDPKKVVMVQHGFMTSAHKWVDNPVNESLGYVLADAGFDVWLPNTRGSPYSLKHKYYSRDSDEYWAFSWDEMAKYDLPSFINFILKETGVKKLLYVGYSQGGQIGLAELNRSPELRSKVAAFGALAPVAFLGEIKTPIASLAPICSSLKMARYTVGGFKLRSFPPSPLLMRILAKLFCSEPVGDTPVCTNPLFFLTGSDTRNLDLTRLKVLLARTSGVTSVRNIVHYCQSYLHGRFQMFDFGSDAENEAHYGQVTPPMYGLDKLAAGPNGIPVRIYWGGNDSMATPNNVKLILAGLRENAEEDVDVSDVEVPEYDHKDFAMAMDAPIRVYADLIHFLNSHI